MIVLPGNSCFPAYEVFTDQVILGGCCQILYFYNQSVGIPSNTCFGQQENYYPNRCTGSPRTALGRIGEMIFPCTVNWDVIVDDDAIINGSVWEPGQHLVTLGGGINAADCSTFPGGTSLCNGAHRSIGTVTRIPGQFFTFQAADNHGIQCYANGVFEVQIAGAP